MSSLLDSVLHGFQSQMSAMFNGAGPQPSIPGSTGAEVGHVSQDSSNWGVGVAGSVPIRTRFQGPGDPVPQGQPCSSGVQPKSFSASMLKDSIMQQLEQDYSDQPEVDMSDIQEQVSDWVDSMVEEQGEITHHAYVYRGDGCCTLSIGETMPPWTGPVTGETTIWFDNGESCEGTSILYGFIATCAANDSGCECSPQFWGDCHGPYSGGWCHGLKSRGDPKCSYVLQIMTNGGYREEQVGELELSPKESLCCITPYQPPGFPPCGGGT